jgi:hypothetical protein
MARSKNPDKTAEIKIALPVGMKLAISVKEGDVIKMTSERG